MLASSNGRTEDFGSSYWGSSPYAPATFSSVCGGIGRRTMTIPEITKLASVTAKRAGAFRQAIAVGNAREIELEDLDPALFE